MSAPPPRRRHRQSRTVYLRRRITIAAFVTVVAVAVAVFLPGNHSLTKRDQAAGRIKVSHPATHPTPTHHAQATYQDVARWLAPSPPGSPGYLAPGSNPSVLPGPILIADKLNNRLIVVDPQGRVRWIWPRPGDLAPGQSFQIPDDAFFSPDGRYIIATQEDDFAITVIDIATRKIVWRYGHPGTSGSAPGYLWNPDDAMILRNGRVLAADIKNCRLIEIPHLGTAVSWQEGQLGTCTHNPPAEYGSPNGMFPLPNGHFLVTEINGDWVDEIDTSGHVYWSANPPNVAYPSDSNQYAPGEYLTVDYSSPGQAVIFNRAGQTIWRYDVTSGPGALDHPSLAMPLPNGDILLNDDYNHRVIVIDPRTNRIVWQYGHDGVAGSAPGYLDNPDGLDPLSPYSYADRYQPKS